MNHTKFRLDEISYKYAKFLTSEACDKQENNHDNFGKFSKVAELPHPPPPLLVVRPIKTFLSLHSWKNVEPSLIKSFSEGSTSLIA